MNDEIDYENLDDLPETDMAYFDLSPDQKEANKAYMYMGLGLFTGGIATLMALYINFTRADGSDDVAKAHFLRQRKLLAIGFPSLLISLAVFWWGWDSNVLIAVIGAILFIIWAIWSSLTLAAGMGKLAKILPPDAKL